MIGGALAWLLSRLSPAAIVAIGVFVFYEGVPVVKEIETAVPIVRYVPAVGTFLDGLALGRVEKARQAGHDAGVAEERAAWVKAAQATRDKAAELRAADADRKAEAERQYLADRAERALHAGELKEVLNDLENAPSTDDRCHVPSVPKRLSIAIDNAGRSRPRNP